MSYTTLEDLKAELGYPEDDATYDTLLQQKLDEATAFIERHTEKRFGVTTDTTRYLDAVDDVDNRRLWLGAWCAGITSIVNGDGVAVTADQYATYPYNETPFFSVRLKLSSGLAWTYDDDPEGAIAVTGKWGYAIDVPADVAAACTLIATHLFRRRENSGGDLDRTVVVAGATLLPAALPREAMDLLKNYLGPGVW